MYSGFFLLISSQFRTRSDYKSSFWYAQQTFIPTLDKNREACRRECLFAHKVSAPLKMWRKNPHRAFIRENKCIWTKFSPPSFTANTTWAQIVRIQAAPLRCFVNSFWHVEAWNEMKAHRFHHYRLIALSSVSPPHWPDSFHLIPWTVIHLLPCQPKSYYSQTMH